MQITLTREFIFDAAQALTVFPEGHKCRQLHGHTFRVQISVTGEIDQKTGMLYDHAIIAQKVRPIIELIDHRYLNEIEGLENPTLENLSFWFWERLKNELPDLSEIVVYETPTAWCRFTG
ncbi:MAG: 6-carboxytetrahydropterin synthase QueD [Verrucomicrobiota bacterium]